MPASIEIKGVDALIRKLGRVEGIKVLQAPMKRATIRIQKDIADYDDAPKPASGEWAAWVNSHSPAKARKIRGAYFAKVKELGRHPGRTGTTGRGWHAPDSIKIRKSANGLTGIVANRGKATPFIQSKRFQSRLHKGRWQTDEDVANRNRNAIVADFEREIRNALNKP